MANLSGKLIFILAVAVVLSWIAARVTAVRYRAAMRRLMREPGASTTESSEAPGASVPGPPWPVSVEANRRAGRRLTLLMLSLSCAIALTSAVVWMWLSFPGEAIPPKRLLAVALLHLWPVVPALALARRWPWLRILAALVLWSVATFLVLLWRSIDYRPLQLVTALALEIGPALVFIGLVLAGNASRAVAPWLLLPFVGLVSTSVAGLDVLTAMADSRSPLLMSLPDWIGAYTVIGAFAVVPWLLAWVPLRMLGRALGHAYTRQHLSDTTVLFATVWAFALADKALTVTGGAGLGAAAMFAPLAWIPAGFWAFSRLKPEQSGRPPTLLVLRVFQRDVQVQRLFDYVIERWRLTGNTVMIAGTDLADRTMDASDIFTFLDGRLASRFINVAADVEPRLAAFVLTPDADGRHRVNECYCRDATWQDALRGLIGRCDVALMDLRGFTARNEGCRFELATLGASTSSLRVVVLVDGATDRGAALQAIGAAPGERFTWIEVDELGRATRRQVLDCLLGGWAPPVAGAAAV